MLIREAGTATIFLADSESYAQEIFCAKLKEGAEFAYDFGISDVIKETAEQMIRDVPLHRMKPFEITEVFEPFSASTYRFKSRTRFDARPQADIDPPKILQQIGGEIARCRSVCGAGLLSPGRQRCQRPGCSVNEVLFQVPTFGARGSRKCLGGAVGF